MQVTRFEKWGHTHFVYGSMMIVNRLLIFAEFLLANSIAHC